MKINRVVIVIMLLAGLFMVAAPSAMAERGKNTGLGQTDYDIPTDKTAAGTKLEGFCTIKYEVDYAGTATATLLMRLRKGNLLYPFAGVLQGVIYDPGNIDNLVGDPNSPLNRVDDFVGDVVVPFIYECGPLSPASGFVACPDYAIKFVDQFVEDLGAPNPCCGGIYFDAMDLTIAVVD